MHAVAALIHGVGWEVDQSILPIAPFVTLMCPRHSSVEDCYFRLCATNGIDDGDPFSFETAVILEDPSGGFASTTEVLRLCSVVAVMSGSALGLCRLIRSADGFRSPWSTETLFHYGEQTDFLIDDPIVDRTLLGDIAVGCKTLLSLDKPYNTPGRLENAAHHFGLAARSPHLDAVCLELELTLDILFDAGTDDNRASRIGESIARFLGHEITSQHATELVDGVLQVRRDLVRQGSANQDTVCDIAPEAFKLTSKLLRKFLLCKELALAVNATAMG